MAATVTIYRLCVDGDMENNGEIDIRRTIWLLVVSLVVLHVECHATLPAPEATFVPRLQHKQTTLKLLT